MRKITHNNKPNNKPRCFYCKYPVEADGGWGMAEIKDGDSIIFHSECGEINDENYADLLRRMNNHEKDF